MENFFYRFEHGNIDQFLTEKELNQKNNPQNKNLPPKHGQRAHVLSNGFTIFDEPKFADPNDQSHRKSRMGNRVP